MKDDYIRTTERRLWNEAVREGMVESLGRDEALRVRRAFQEISKDLESPHDLLAAVSEVLTACVAELQARQRVQSALLRKMWACAVRSLPDGARQEVEHEIRTLNLKDVVL